MLMIVILISCSQGFIGQRCETQDRAVTGRSTQDDSQTGIYIVPN